MFSNTPRATPRCTSRTPEAWITIRKGPWRSWIPRSLATVRRNLGSPNVLFGGHVWVFLYKTPETYFTIFYIYMHAACNLNVVSQTWLASQVFWCLQHSPWVAKLSSSSRTSDLASEWLILLMELCFMFYHIYIYQVHAWLVLKQQLLLNLTAIGP